VVSCRTSHRDRAGSPERLRDRHFGGMKALLLTGEGFLSLRGNVGRPLAIGWPDSAELAQRGPRLHAYQPGYMAHATGRHASPVLPPTRRPGDRGLPFNDPPPGRHPREGFRPLQKRVFQIDRGPVSLKPTCLISPIGDTQLFSTVTSGPLSRDEQMAKSGKRSDSLE
jgi:hypothetical protein